MAESARHSGRKTPWKTILAVLPVVAIAAGDYKDAAAGEAARRVEAHKALAVAHDAAKRALPKGRAAADAGALALCRLCCHQVLPLRPLPRHRHGRRSTGCSVGRGCGSGCRPRRRRCRSRRPPPPRRPSRHRPKTRPGSSGA